MSIKLMSAIWDSDLPVRDATLLVFLSIADHANDAGVCWPSVERIAKRCRITPRHCQRIIKGLEDDGYLEVDRNAGRSNTNVYRVVTEKVTSETEKVTSTSVKGDARVTRSIIEPSIEPSSIVNAIAYDEQSPQAGQAVLPLQQIEQEEKAASPLQSPDATIENKATMRSRKKPSVLTESWRDLLMRVMVGHGDLALVSKQQWGNMRACAKQLQSAGASEDDVGEWWENVWSKGWPGLQDGTVKPANMSQVLQGVGIWKASKQEAVQESVVSHEFQVIEEDME